MPKVTGLESVIKMLKKAKEKAEAANVTFVVGYTQSYGLWVHEDLNAKHEEGKIAKYLESPARTERAEMIRLIHAAKTLRVGLARAALWLQRTSQKLVPIDTGALKNSAFTCEEAELETVAAEARMRSDAILRAAGRIK